MDGVKMFLQRYLEGKKVSEIAYELGVSREWCSRSYRKDGIKFWPAHSSSGSSLGSHKPELCLKIVGWY